MFSYVRFSISKKWISNIYKERFKDHDDARKVLLLIRSFKLYGHLVADIDPLETGNKIPELKLYNHGNRWFESPIFEDFNLKKLSQMKENLDLTPYGFTEKDLDKEFYIGEDLSIGPIATLRKIVYELQILFCNKIGIEYMHLHNRDAAIWIRLILEKNKEFVLSNQEKINIYKQLIHTELFEVFLGKRFSGAKRFSIEGGESLIPAMNHLLLEANNIGIETIFMGMAHRGRLNILGNVLNCTLESIMSRFQVYLPDEPDYPNNSDDVRYHLGTNSFIKMKNGKILNVILTSNPSHLEAVNPVVLGETKSKQIKINDTNGEKTMALLLHGDASMFQGSVREAFGFSNLQDYKTNGTIHIIINNQIGFTTLPRQADSAAYCSDVSKINGCPVFHVNADDPESVIKVIRMAVLYRDKFRKDVVIDLVCYRRHGHNEQDSPEITAPVMYHHIKRHPTVCKLYGNKLIEQNVITLNEIDQIKKKYEKELENALNNSLTSPSSWSNVGDLPSLFTTSNINKKNNMVRKKDHKMYTGVNKKLLYDIGKNIFILPKTFSPHKKVEKIFNNRKKSIETGKRIDWATAEALAFGTIMKDGNNIRLSGQDCERGTFNQRHAVVYDQEAALSSKHSKILPLNLLSTCELKATGRIDVCNSPLSEEGVLGFEYGYSLQAPNDLVLWEAQFGDFANGAQTIIDTFIISGEQRWQHSSSLILLLPHGYEGQGPDHSSARIERFLQQSNEHFDLFQSNTSVQETEININIVIPTTPAQYFHLLRRQLIRKYPKPLIIFTPKYLLHHHLCVSNLNDFIENTKFRSILSSSLNTNNESFSKEKIKKLIFCCGKIYYHSLHAIRAKNIKNIIFIRIEELVPFPFMEIANEIKTYENAEIIWTQEEPQNMGAWTFIYPRFITIFKYLNENRKIKYIGKQPSSSAATGQYEIHVQEMKDLIYFIIK